MFWLRLAFFHETKVHQRSHTGLTCCLHGLQLKFYSERELEDFHENTWPNKPQGRRKIPQGSLKVMTGCPEDKTSTLYRKHLFSTCKENINGLVLCNFNSVLVFSFWLHLTSWKCSAHLVSYGLDLKWSTLIKYMFLKATSWCNWIAVLPRVQ